MSSLPIEIASPEDCCPFSPLNETNRINPKAISGYKTLLAIMFISCGDITRRVEIGNLSASEMKRGRIVNTPNRVVNWLDLAKGRMTRMRKLSEITSGHLGVISFRLNS